MSRRILVVSGSSGGHIFPAVSFLEALKEKEDREVLLVLPKTSIVSLAAFPDIPIEYISIAPIALNPRGLINLLNFLKGSLESLFILLEFKPDTVAAFGSLACLPLVILAWGLRIKILIHEQNVIPGRANRLLAVFADRIAVSFDETRHYFKEQNKIVFTGNPLRRELIRVSKKEASDFFGLSENKFTILVMGGSQGAHKINLEFQRAISKIPDRSKLQVIHLTGRKDYDFLKAGYKGLGVEVRLFDFLKDMRYAYSAADLVLSRAGALTIAELIHFRLPAILVPYPFAYKHQAANAKVLEQAGCAIIIDNGMLASCALARVIDDFMVNPSMIKERITRYQRFAITNANELLLREVISL